MGIQGQGYFLTLAQSHLHMKIETLVGSLEIIAACDLDIS